MDELQQLGIEYLLNNTALGNRLKEAITIVEDVQEKLLAYLESPEEDALKKIKVGTILTMAVLTKMSGGVNPRDFTKEDWREIADKVQEYALELDPEQYTKLVFLMYAGYIEASSQLISDRLTEESTERLMHIVGSLRDKSEQLDNGEITETVYTEDCLWLCLEAMIKLVSSFIASHMTEEYGVLLEAIATFAFEYGRYMLYQNEHALVEEYLAHQKVVDEELQAKYDAYIRCLEEDQKRFMQLVENAFDPDFANTLKNSVALARAAGVHEDEILDSIDKIDDFFS